MRGDEGPLALTMEPRWIHDGRMAAKSAKTTGARAKRAPKEAELRVRCHAAEKAAWRAAADKEDRSVSAWLRVVANREAGFNRG